MDNIQKIEKQRSNSKIQQKNDQTEEISLMVSQKNSKYSIEDNFVYQHNLSLLSNFSYYPTSISITTFHDIRIKVISNSNQIITKLFGNQNLFQFPNMDSKNDKQYSIQNIVYSIVYIYQEKLRNQVQMYVLAPLTLNYLVNLHQLLINFKCQKSIEIFLPIENEQFWFMLHIYFQNQQPFYEYIQLEQQQINEESQIADQTKFQIKQILRQVKYIERNINKKQENCINKDNNKSYLIVLEEILNVSFNNQRNTFGVQLNKEQKIQEDEFMNWSMDLLTSAALDCPLQVEEVACQLQVFNTQQIQKTEISPMRKSNQNKLHSEELLEEQGLCVFCLTWPFRSIKQNSLQI